jgi:nicotinamidase-related amidase
LGGFDRRSSVRHESAVALILVDVINHFEFPDGRRLLRNALPIAPKLARLKARARRSSIPVIYVNDNFGQWRSNASKLLEYCVRPDALGREFVESVRPDEQDYLVLKPMHSAFYQSPLDILLRHLGASCLILCGLATNSCIICTAHDANMRDYRLFVPSDCCAARTGREHQQAIEHVKNMSDANISCSSTLRLATLKRCQKLVDT